MINEPLFILIAWVIRVFIVRRIQSLTIIARVFVKVLFILITSILNDS